MRQIKNDIKLVNNIQKHLISHRKQNGLHSAKFFALYENHFHSFYMLLM